MKLTTLFTTSNRTMRLCFLLLVLTLGGAVNALTGQTFVRSYGLPDSRQEGLSLLPLNADTLVLAATKEDSTQLLFLDPAGNLLFNRSFKFARANWKDYVTCIKRDSQNMIYAVGYGRGSGNNGLEGFAFRYDYLNDQLLWRNTWSLSSDGLGIIEYTPGKYMVFGEDRGLTAVGENGLMAKMDAATGNITDAFQYDLNSSETFRSSVFLNNTFYAAGRFTLMQSFDKMRASMARLDQNGTLLQSRSFLAEDTASARFYSTDLTIFDQQSLLMASYGNPEGDGATPRFVYLSKHDLLTDLIWGNEYNITDSPGEVPIEVIRDGNQILVLGRIETPAQTAFIMSTDLAGNLNWCRSYPLYLKLPTLLGEGQMVVWNNSIYMTGASPEAATGDFDNIGLVRTNLDGSLNAPCETDSHAVAQISNIISYPNGLRDSSSTVIDTTLSTAQFTPPLNQEPLCGTGGGTPCEAASDSLFTKFNGSVTLRGYHSWDGKMYLADGVTITLTGGNTTLDLTNVDVVFGECAGIDFVDGAKLRANNSVFRPCEPSRSWRGFTFNNADSSVVNACTFKNAQRALYFQGLGDVPGQLACRISNNLFANNRTGIESSFMSITGAVSGNTFLVDGQPIEFSPEGCALSPAYADDHWGVRAYATEWKALISQNDFINGRGPDDPQDLHGVLAVMSSGTFSHNRFSNAFRGVELSECNEVTVENNQFETTQNFFDQENQIRATGHCSWVWITGNQLTNSNENRGGVAGIFVDESNIINIKENRVEGFAQGIYIRNLNTAQVAGNELWNNLLYGIYQENGNGVDVNCNRIYMHYRPGQGAFGMGYFHQDGQVSQNRFRSNCVWDAEVALVTSSPSGDTLPWIRNNYFYNYENAGLLNIGCNGNIGTQINPISFAGRNTFRSNNTAATATAAAFDIFSTTAIAAFGNTGIANVTGNVFVNGANLHGSTAACGNQAGNENAEFLNVDICDNFYEQLNATEEALAKKNYAEFQHLSDKDEYGLVKAWMQYFESNEQGNMAEQLRIHAEAQLPTDYARRLEIDQHWQRGEHPLASQKLATFSGSSRMLGLAKIGDHLMHSRDIHPPQIDDLIQWQNPQDAWGDHARDLLHLRAMRADYRFRDAIVPQYDLSARRISVAQSRFTISPNPNSGNFQLEYVFPQGESGQIEVYDTHGRILFQTSLDSQAGMKAIDLRQLPMGIYFLRLSQETQVLGTQKWIKLE